MKDNKYTVDIERTCIRDYHDGKPYGDWESEYDNSFRSITRSDDKRYGDIESSLDIKDGEKCWVVWLEYSSGDSFGSGTRNDIALLGVFTEEAAADELKKAILKHSDKDRNYGSIKLTTCDGQTFDLYTSWLGYFERLDEVHIERATMGDIPSRRRR